MVWLKFNEVQINFFRVKTSFWNVLLLKKWKLILANQEETGVLGNHIEGNKEVEASGHIVGSKVFSNWMA